MDAALECFLECGIEAGSIEDICRASGASVGSVYHQFGSKAGIAAALYLDAVRDFQSFLVRRLERAGSARSRVRSIVAAHLAWVEANPGRARFLHEARHTETVSDHAGELLALNRDFGRAVAASLRPAIDSGELRRMPPDLLIAVLLGPTHEYVRGVLSGRAGSSMRVAARALSEAAWQALRSGDGNDAARGTRP